MPRAASEHYDRPSGYGGGTQLDKARSFADDFIRQVEAGQVNEQTAYGENKDLRAEEYTLAGGGPAADITFLLDGDGAVVGAYLTYYEGNGPVTISLTDYDAQAAYSAMRQAPED